MTTVSEAEALILAAVPQAAAVDVPLADARGAVLREPLTADRPFPPYNRVAMDGIALSHATWAGGGRAFPVAGVVRAGEAPRALPDPSQCLEIMTGAVLPPGCDCVVPVEQLVVAGGVATLRDGVAVDPMQHVHRLGSDRPAGATLLNAGTMLWGPACAVAASVGNTHLRVSSSPRITIVSTGDELVPVEATPLPHQVRRSNAYALGAALATAGFTDIRTAHAPDDPAAIARTLRAALADSRFIVLSGGVSEGRFDHVPGVLATLGVVQRLHKVSQRPGKPLWFGIGPDGQAVFGLPGNPVSAAVCLYRYVLPALWRHVGAGLRSADARPRAVLTVEVRFKKPLTLFQPVRVCEHTDGRRLATPVPMNGSGDLAGLAVSDGVLELPDGGRTFAAGEAHVIWLWADPYGMLMQTG